MTEPYLICPVSHDEFAAFRAVDEHAFHSGPPPEREMPLLRRLFETERSLVR
jgi:hypothetical protein